MSGTVSVPDKEYIKWWVDEVAVSDSKGLAGYADLLCKVDCRDFLEDINVPTLILAPIRSAVTSVEEQKNIQARIPGAELELIDASGYDIYVEKPEACQVVFLRFVQSLPRA
jgi:pimeloyl-ACP methyl ester carboxylesterase